MVHSDDGLHTASDDSRMMQSHVRKPSQNGLSLISMLCNSPPHTHTPVLSSGPEVRLSHIVSALPSSTWLLKKHLSAGYSSVYLKCQHSKGCGTNANLRSAQAAQQDPVSKERRLL